jgi:hypothetical protein
LNDELKKLTPLQAAIVGAYTGVLVGDFADMHEYIERKLGRRVSTGEMGLRGEDFLNEVRTAVKADLLAIVADPAPEEESLP